MNAPRLSLIETPPASAEAIARLLSAAREGGKALSLDVAESAKRLALDCLAIDNLGDAARPGVREQSARMALALVAFAQSIERLA